MQWEWEEEKEGERERQSDNVPVCWFPNTPQQPQARLRFKTQSWELNVGFPRRWQEPMTGTFTVIPSDQL